jgi:hypothetical protein
LLVGFTAFVAKGAESADFPQATRIIIAHGKGVTLSFAN